MAVITYEGVVEEGKIRLNSRVHLPEKLKVYVIVPEMQAEKQKPARVLTPRLVHSKQASDFKMKVVKE